MNTKHLITRLAAAALAMLALSTTSATAGVIVKPTSVSLALTLGTVEGGGESAINGIDGSGFTVGDQALIANGANDIGSLGTSLGSLPQSLNNDAYNNSSRIVSGGGYGSQQIPAGSAAWTFTLPAAYSVNGIYLWSLSESGALFRGIRNATVALSTNNGSTFGTAVNVTFGLATFPPGNVTPVFVGLTETAGVNAIKLTYIDNQSGTSITEGALGGFGEIRFTAVPEPATWALLAGGLTTVMVLRRRRA